MRISRLDAFLALADHGDLDRAAARLGASVDGIVAMIDGFERSLGLVLFARGPGRFTLTAAGRALVERADDALEALERLDDRRDGELGGEEREGRQAG